MLILDKDRALDRMIWLSGRHALVVPEEFSHDHAAAAGAPPFPNDAAWRWSGVVAARPEPVSAQSVHLTASRSAA